MSPFVIFAIVLTILYVMYYGIVISKDLYSKKGQDKESKETIEMPDVLENELEVAFHAGKRTNREKEKVDETPTPVTEKGDSFVVGNEPGEATDEMNAEPNDRESDYDDTATKSDAEKVVDQLKKNMLQADVESEGEMNDDELEKTLISQQVSLFVEPKPKPSMIKAIPLSEDACTDKAAEPTTTDKSASDETGHKEEKHGETKQKTEPTVRDAI